MTMSMSPQGHYEDGLRQGVLRFQACLSCGATVFYPRTICPTCGLTTLEWRESAGDGQVYSATTIHPREATPYNVTLVDLDEGFRMMSRVVGGEAPIGQRVRFAVEMEPSDSGERPVAVFERVEEDV